MSIIFNIKQKLQRLDQKIFPDIYGAFAFAILASLFLFWTILGLIPCLFLGIPFYLSPIVGAIFHFVVGMAI